MTLFNSIGSFINIGIRGGDSGEPTIIDFLAEHGLAQWPKTGAGWRYWANTTSTGEFGRDYQDTIQENIFANVTNGPLTDWLSAPLKPHFQPGQDVLSDPYLLTGQITARGMKDADGYPVYDPVNDCIHWYSGGMWHRTIYNDLSVGPYMPLIDVHGVNISETIGGLIGSPSVVRHVLPDSSVRWHLWYNHFNSGGPSDLIHRYSDDNRATWSDPEYCTLPSTHYVNYWHPTFKKSMLFPGQVDFFGGGYGRVYPEYTGPYSGQMVGTLAHVTLDNPTDVKIKMADNILLEPFAIDEGDYQIVTGNVYRTCGLIRLDGNSAYLNYFADIMELEYQAAETTSLTSGTLAADALSLSINPARWENGVIKVPINGVDHWYEGAVEMTPNGRVEPVYPDVPIHAPTPLHHVAKGGGSHRFVKGGNHHLE